MSKIDHAESLRNLSDWLISNDYDMTLGEDINDPADAAEYIDFLAKRVQELEQTLRYLADPFWFENLNDMRRTAKEALSHDQA